MQSLFAKKDKSQHSATSPEDFEHLRPWTDWLVEFCMFFLTNIHRCPVFDLPVWLSEICDQLALNLRRSCVLTDGVSAKSSLRLL